MTPLKIAALAISAGALVATSAIAAQTSGTAPTAEQKKTARDRNRMVCRNLTMSGTRLSSRHCQTQADWEQQERDSQDAALQQQNGRGDRPVTGPPKQ